MTTSEQGAREWLGTELGVSRETLERLGRLVDLVTRENRIQNLVAASTLEHIWQRHIVDSAQLLLHAEDADADWLDIGTGAGFPGLVIAALHSGHVTLVEPRKLRADFLRRAAQAMGVTPAIITAKIGQIPRQFPGIISARAVAPLTDLLRIAWPFSTEKTRFILPKGRNAQSELEAAQAAWQGGFRSAPSLTDPDARIVIVEGLRGPRRRAGT